MVAFVYDLMFTFPITFFSVSEIIGMLAPNAEKRLLILGIISAELTVMCYRHLNNQLRIILSGIIVIGLVGFALLLRYGKNQADVQKIGLFAVIFLSAAVISVLGIVINCFDKLKYLTAGLFVLILALECILRSNVTKWQFSIAVFFVVLCIAERIQRKRTLDIKKYIVFTSLFPILFMLFLLKTPVSDKPYDWAFFISTWERIKTYSIELSEKLFHGNDEDYSTSMINFSEEGNLAESVGGESKAIIKVHANRPLGERIYLAGKRFDTFDGRVWVASGEEFDNERLFSTIELEYNALTTDSADTKDYYLTANISFEYQSFTSKHIFAPLYTSRLEMIGEQVDEIYEDGSMLFEKPMGYDTKYNMTSYVLNRGNDAIKAMIEKESRYDEQLLGNILIKYPLLDKKDFSFDAYERYREYVYTRYLSETKLSKRAEELIENIVEAGTNDYERLNLLQEYLNGYAYTYAPGKLPEYVTDEASFLDYFMFDSKQGLCSHFSTAFTIMARYLGIPARYVQGYCLTMKGTDNTFVETSMAHGWVEAYIDGVGFVTFDPMPGRMIETSWVPSFEKEKKEFTEEDYREYYNREREEEQLPILETKVEEKTIKWYWVIIPVALIIAFPIAYELIDYLVIKKRLDKAKDREKAILLCRMNLYHLEYAGYRLNQGETLAEYQKRLEKEISKASLAFIEMFEKLLYSDFSISKEEERAIEVSSEHIALLLKDEKKALFFFYYLRGMQKL